MKSSFTQDFEILVFCKQFGIHGDETGTSSIYMNIHVYAKLPGHDVTQENYAKR